MARINFQAAGTSISTSGGSTSQSTYRQYTHVTVYMIAGKNFSFVDYRPYLQQLAEGSLQVQSWFDFEDILKDQLGVKIDPKQLSQTNVWFDIDNDVLWTLSESNRQALILTLNRIKEKLAVRVEK